PLPTTHPRIMRAQEEFLPWPMLSAQMALLDQSLNANEVPAIRALLQSLVHGYQPENPVVDWIYLAKKSTKENSGIESTLT
ncbi:MAG: polysaccharide biosynthesis protein, partial [Rhodoferax sp.]|nr:polysaccharide biosynthesis protein [Rhodoferax sp.]